MNENKKERSGISAPEQSDLIMRELDKSLLQSNAASATDCTGTVVRGPLSTGVAEAYDDVYHFKPQIPEALRRK
ncbi:MAG: hypothetical protein E7260_07595 [Lachnospiraceae bacterium]|nr:hypothetical protein [Lachnospiraceae bacterium]